MACGNMVGYKVWRSTKNPRKPRNKRLPGFRGRRSKKANRLKPLLLCPPRNRSFLLREMQNRPTTLQSGLERAAHTPERARVAYTRVRAKRKSMPVSRGAARALGRHRPEPEHIYGPRRWDRSSRYKSPHKNCHKRETLRNTQKGKGRCVNNL